MCVATFNTESKNDAYISVGTKMAGAASTCNNKGLRRVKSIILTIILFIAVYVESNSFCLLSATTNASSELNPKMYGKSGNSPFFNNSYDLFVTIALSWGGSTLGANAKPFRMPTKNPES